MSSDLNDLGLLLDSKVPILVIESFEEPRVLEMITRLAVKKALVLYTWSMTEGLNRLGFGSDRPQDDKNRDPPSHASSEHKETTAKERDVKRPVQRGIGGNIDLEA